jgi:hypothetical protein
MRRAPAIRKDLMAGLTAGHERSELRWLTRGGRRDLNPRPPEPHSAQGDNQSRHFVGLHRETERRCRTFWINEAIWAGRNGTKTEPLKRCPLNAGARQLTEITCRTRSSERGPELIYVGMSGRSTTRSAANGSSLPCSIVGRTQHPARIDDSIETDALHVVATRE